MADDLYDQDLYLWPQAQAAALCTRAGDADGLDRKHLAEEDWGRAESHAPQILSEADNLTARTDI